MEAGVKVEQEQAEFISTAEAARMCHVSAQCIINWLEAGRFGYERIGSGPRRILKGDVEAYLAKHRKVFPGRPQG